MTVDLNQLLLIWITVLLASILRSFSGFGFALSAVPIFALFLSPIESVVMSASLTLVISFMGFSDIWRQVSLKPMIPLLVMALIGTIIGVGFLAVISIFQFQLFVGIAVISACIGMLVFKPILQKRSSGLSGLVGLVSGFMNGALAMPGPPIVVYAMLTESDPKRTRAMLMAFFMVTSLLAVTSFGVAGYINMHAIENLLFTLPVLYTGNKLGSYLFRKYGDVFYRNVALLSLFVIGVATILRAVL